MGSDCSADAELPDHVDQTVRLIAKLHSNHREAATRVERVVERAVVSLGGPSALAILGCFAAGWIALNTALGAAGFAVFDEPPFAYLALIAALTSLGVTMLILITQRRDDQLDRHREQMTLQLALLSEQKLAKIIALLEESRRDNPLMTNRVDPSADALSEPADPEMLGDAIMRKDQFT